MKGGEDAASTAMVVKVKGEQGGGEMADRQTDRQTRGQCRYRNMGFRHTQLQAGGAFKRL